MDEAQDEARDTAPTKAQREQALVALVRDAAKVTKLPFEEVEHILRAMTDRRRGKREPKQKSPEELAEALARREESEARSRARQAAKQRAKIAAEQRARAELAAARTLLDRIAAVEKLMDRVAAIQATITANAHEVIKDANATLAVADHVMQQARTFDARLAQVEDMELEARLRRRLKGH